MSNSRVQWLVVALTLLVGFGVVANPWIQSVDQVFVIEILAMGGWLAYEFWRAARDDLRSESGPTAATSIRHRTAEPDPSGVSFLAVASLLFIGLMWAFIYRVRWLSPRRMPDDDVLYAAAIDWPTTWHPFVGTRG